MDVVYFGSRELYGDFTTAINSLRAYNKANVYAIIEDDCLDIPDVTYIKWDYRTLFNDTNTRTKWKHFGVLRAALSFVLPLDKVLSLDVDTIVTGDLTELWETDLTGYDMAMVREPYLSYGDPYYNAGVCLMNLAELRSSGTDIDMVKDLNTDEYRYVAQDVITRRCRIKDIPSKWNSCMFTEHCYNPSILHFANRTDWRDLPVVSQYR